MLAQVVLVKEMLLHSICARIEQHCMQIHKSDFFHHYGVMHCVYRILSSCERTMAEYHNSGNIFSCLAVKGLDDDFTCLFFILTNDLRFRHRARTRNVTVEVITVCRSHGRDALTGLGKCRCPA